MNTQIPHSEDWRFFWNAPVRPLAIPSVTFGAPVSTTVPLSAIHADIAVDSIGVDRRTITLTAPIAAGAGLIAEHGGAVWLDLGASMQAAVVIESFDSPTVARLSRPLPIDSGTVTGGSISWRTFYADLTSLQVGAVVKRGCPWSISWETNPGADVVGRKVKSTGLIDIVTTPFDTGLDHDGFVARFNLFSGVEPVGQTSWAPQIRAGLSTLKNRLIGRLDAGQYLDQVQGYQFLDAHALIVADMIARSMRQATYDVETLPVQIAREINRQFGGRGLRWVDRNSDGVVDDGETNVMEPSAVGVCSSGLDDGSSGYSLYGGMEVR